METRQVLIDGLLDELKQDIELRKFYQQEKLILDVTELVSKLMKKKKVNKTRLAELLGVGKSNVTQLLDGTTNMTLRTISDVFTSLDSELVVNEGSLSLGLSQTYQYESVDPTQTTTGILPEDLPSTNWIPKDNRKKLVA